MKRLLLTSIILMSLVTGETVAQAKHHRVLSNAYNLWAIGPVSNECYGLFVKKQLMDNWCDFEVRKINIKDYFIAPETVNEQRVKKDQLVYVLSGFDSLSTNIRGWKCESGYLLPGQSFFAGDYHIYAKGEIVETVDSTSVEVFDGVDNFRVGVKMKVREKIIDRIITKGYRLTRWMPGDYLGGISVGR